MMALSVPGLLMLAMVFLVSSTGRAAELRYEPRVAPERSRAPVVVADGQPLVSRAELGAAMADVYYRAAVDAHRHERAWLDEFLPDQILGLEAHRRGMRPEQLVRTEMNVDPSDASRWEAARRQLAERLGKKEGGLSVTLPAPNPPAPGGGGADLVYTRGYHHRLASVAVATVRNQRLVDGRMLAEALSIVYYRIARDVWQRELDWLRPVVHERLVALEAARRGMSRDDLLKTEVGATGNDSEVRRRASEAYAERLWQQARVTVRLPEPERPEIHAAESNTGPVLGLGDAPINIVEFCSFSRRECRDAWVVYAEVVRRLGARVRIAHRDAPDLADPVAVRAAIAARCAHRQKRFWAYHDMLYESQDRLGDPAALKAFAGKLGLDSVAFERCLDRAETGEEVRLDAREARRLSLAELPTLFINARYVTGVLTVDETAKQWEALAIQ